MTYQEAIQYLNSFINYEKKSNFAYKQSFKIERIKGFLNIIDNPQDYFKSIHIAGTKGKGSVCAFLAYILKEAGFTVGLYTSPHLSSVRERIRILNLKVSSFELQASGKQKDKDFAGIIPKHDLTNLVKKLKPKIDEYSKSCPYGPLSFFEVYTAMAFEYFKDKNVDFAVLETGLGGRLDATNVVSPLCCGITSLSFDHMDKLGNTLSKIAGEKAGIIKKSPGKRLFVVTAPQDKEALSVIRNRAKQEKVRLYEIGKDIFFKKNKSGRNLQSFEVSGILGKLKDLKIKLLGNHQLINAALAISIIQGLRKFYSVKINDKNIHAGLYKTFWPVRFEVFPTPVPLVLDGAHNVDSIKALGNSLKEVFPDKSFTFIFGASEDKDIKGMCREIAPVCKRLILTRAKNPRAKTSGEILLCAKNYKNTKDIVMAPDIREALKQALKNNKTDNVIVVCGSLFLVAEAREWVFKKNDK